MAHITDLILQNLPLPYPSYPFDDKTVIVTGSNTGLGLEAARHFARLGAARVILAVRNLEKGESAKSSIVSTTDCNPSTIEVWKLDMSSFAGTNEFIERALALPKLDVVVLNAGVATSDWRVTEDGWESTLQVNVLSTALLALRLLPKMVRSGKENPRWRSHLVIVASEVHRWGSVAAQYNTWPTQAEKGILAHINDRAKTEKDMGARYPLSKLLDVYLTREIAKITPVDKSGKPAVVVNTLNPGLCHSELGRELGLGLKVIKMLFARPTEKGSRTLVDAACKGPRSHGCYLSNCEIETPADWVTSDDGQATQKRFWNEMLDVLEPVSPGLKKSVQELK
ncbi:putative short-chain dehydrogenase [Morchella snyderi]|nr:putative short-chain dehydrogenase [Morchella snyderi]